MTLKCWNLVYRETFQGRFGDFNLPRIFPKFVHTKHWIEPFCVYCEELCPIKKIRYFSWDELWCSRSDYFLFGVDRSFLASVIRQKLVILSFSALWGPITPYGDILANHPLGTFWSLFQYLSNDTHIKKFFFPLPGIFFSRIFSRFFNNSTQRPYIDSI